MLRQSDGYLSGQQLCDHFQVSRTAVWKAINQLKEEGYEIEAVRNKGYRIVDIPDRITADAIKSCLETKWMAKNLEYYDEIDSTNNRAKALGEAGGADGTLFVAETQTAGKRKTRQMLAITGGQQYFHVDSVKTCDESVRCTDADTCHGICGNESFA